jgi:hypothetical protein
MTTKEYVVSKLTNMFSSPSFNVFVDYNRDFNQSHLPLIDINVLNENYEYMTQDKKKIRKQVEVLIQCSKVNNNYDITETVERALTLSTDFRSLTINSLEHENDSTLAVKDLKTSKFNLTIVCHYDVLTGETT